MKIILLHSNNFKKEREEITKNELHNKNEMNKLINNENDLLFNANINDSNDKIKEK